MASAECCGQTHSSRFCPHCGKLLQKHCIETLLAHCRQSKKLCQRTLDSRDDYPDQSQSTSSSLRKWEAWVDCLEKIIESRHK